MRASTFLLTPLAFVALVGMAACMPPAAPQAESLHAGRGAWRVRSEEWPSSARDDRRAIEAAEASPTYVPEGPRLPPRVAPADPERTPFDSAAALASIHAVDISACVARGVPTGYGHAHLTFEGGGTVSHVAVESPTGLSEDAIACVGEELGRAHVAPFDGGSVSVGSSFLVGQAGR